MQNLLSYLNEVKDADHIHTNFNLITHAKEFQDFKHAFFNTKGVTLLPDKVDELFVKTAETMQESFNLTLQNTINNLEEKMNEVRTLTPAKVLQSR